MSFERTPRGQTPRRREGLTLVGPGWPLIVADNLQVVTTLENAWAIQADLHEELVRSGNEECCPD